MVSTTSVDGNWNHSIKSVHTFTELKKDLYAQKLIYFFPTMWINLIKFTVFPTTLPCIYINFHRNCHHFISLLSICPIFCLVWEEWKFTKQISGKEIGEKMWKKTLQKWRTICFLPIPTCCLAYSLSIAQNRSETVCQLKTRLRLQKPESD